MNFGYSAARSTFEVRVRAFAERDDCGTDTFVEWDENQIFSADDAVVEVQAVPKGNHARERSFSRRWAGSRPRLYSYSILIGSSRRVDTSVALHSGCSKLACTNIFFLPATRRSEEEVHFQKLAGEWMALRR